MVLLSAFLAALPVHISVYCVFPAFWVITLVGWHGYGHELIRYPSHRLDTQGFGHERALEISLDCRNTLQL